MKKKIIIIVLALLILAAAVGAAADVYHITAYRGDHYWMLCADGRWNVQINGGDSIRVDCVGNSR